MHRGVAATVAFALVFGFLSTAARPEDGALELSPELAVSLAIENNLGLRAARYGPRLAAAELGVSRSAWTPELLLTATAFDAKVPLGTSLAGDQASSDEQGTSSELGLGQRLPWGASYRLGLQAARRESDGLFARFVPQLSAGLEVSYTQQLLHPRDRDAVWTQTRIEKTRVQIAGLELDAAIATTRRRALRAYWQWVHAQNLLAVERQTLELARQLLAENRTRVERGAMASVDVVGAEAEVARRNETIVVAESNLAIAERVLRALILDPENPGFARTLERPAGLSMAVGNDARDAEVRVEAAVRLALASRQDLNALRKTLEIDTIVVRQLRAASHPDLELELAYRSDALGGTELLRGPGFPGQLLGTRSRDLGAVLGDALNGDLASWTATLTLSQPLGASAQERERATASLRREQRQATLHAAEVDVTTEVTAVALRAIANRRRLDTTHESVALAERRLEGEQRKFNAGLSTSFFVFQAQRDLADAREAELRAQLDYRLSKVDLEAVQLVPVGLAE